MPDKDAHPDAPAADAWQDGTPEPAGSTQSGHRRGLIKTLLQAGAHRIVLAGILLWWGSYYPFRAPSAGHFYYHGVEPQAGTLGDLCVKWDGYWYLNIIDFGYSAQEQGQSNQAFFPAYPFLVGALAQLGCEPATAGVLLSTGCFFLAMLFAYLFAETRYGCGAGAATVLWLCAFPSSWTFHMVLSDALFCAAIFAFLWLHASERYRWAAALAVVVPLIRGVGLALLAALVGDLLVRWFRGKELPRGLLLPCCGGLLGWGALAGVYTAISGSPLGFLGQGKPWAADYGVQQSWFPLLSGTLKTLDNPGVVLGTIFWVILLAVLIFMWTRDGGVERYFATAYTAVVMLFSIQNSQLRYMLALLPLHATLACFLRRRGWLSWALMILTILQLLITRMYLDWLLAT